MYLSTRYLQTPRTSKKLDYKYLGLFCVNKIVNNATYALELPSTISIYLTFYVSLLEGAIEAKLAQREQSEVQPQILAA